MVANIPLGLLLSQTSVNLMDYLSNEVQQFQDGSKFTRCGEGFKGPYEGNMNTIYILIF